MPITIIATPGDPAANSYQTLAEFKSYIALRTPVVAWTTGASDDTLSSAMIIGTLLLDSCFDWTGVATLPTQNRSWPRTGMLNRNGFLIDPLSIPDELKYAQSEFSLAVGSSDLFADNDAAKANIAAIKAGSVEVQFQSTRSDSREAIDLWVRRLGPEFRYLSNAVPEAVRLMLIPSWYNQGSITRPFMFRPMGGN